MKRYLPAAFAAVSILFATAAGAHGLTNTSADYGNAVHGGAGRTIVIKPDTKSVNVANGETVEFQVEGKSFVWHFNTFQPEVAFPLAKIAPQGSKVGDINVYAVPNPLYR